MLIRASMRPYFLRTSSTIEVMLSAPVTSQKRKECGSSLALGVGGRGSRKPAQADQEGSVEGQQRRLPPLFAPVCAASRRRGLQLRVR